jgi:hypothetical protein
VNPFFETHGCAAFGIIGEALIGKDVAVHRVAMVAVFPGDIAMAVIAALDGLEVVLLKSKGLP